MVIHTRRVMYIKKAPFRRARVTIKNFYQDFISSLNLSASTTTTSISF